MKACVLLLFFICIINVSCYKDPSSVRPAEVITHLSASPELIPADGNSRSIITAEIPFDAVEGKAGVSFATSKGSFFETGKTSYDAKAEKIEEEGVVKRVARATLISSPEPGTATITISAQGYQRTQTVSFQDVKPHEVISDVTASNEVITADGVSRTTIVVQLLNGYSYGKSNVTFTTDKGTFLESAKTSHVSPIVKIEENGSVKMIAEATLLSSLEVGTATVDVIAENHQRSKTVSFSRAEPKSLRLTTDRINLTSSFSSEVTITAAVSRPIGRPSLGVSINVTAKDTLGRDRGYFRNGSTKEIDADGKSNFIFTMGNDTYLGKITVKAQLPEYKEVAPDSVNFYVTSTNK